MCVCVCVCVCLCGGEGRAEVGRGGGDGGEDCFYIFYILALFTCNTTLYPISSFACLFFC